MIRTMTVPCLLVAAAFGCGALQTAPTEADPAASADGPVESSEAPEPAAAPDPAPEPARPSPVAPGSPPAALAAAPVAAPEPPPAAAPPPAAPEPAQPLVKTRDRLINVGAKCAAAESAYQDIRASTAKLGLSPHPDIATAFQRMKLAFQSAEREVAAGDEAAAHESLAIAEASADKVLRAAGGN